MCCVKPFGTETRKYSGRTLQWRHNGLDSVSNHQPRKCLLSRLIRRRSKKISKLCVTGPCAGIHRRPVNFPHKGPVTRKMFPFDDVIMETREYSGRIKSYHMASNELAPCYTSAAMILNMQDKQALTFSKERFQVLVPSHCEVMTENANMILHSMK